MRLPKNLFRCVLASLYEGLSVRLSIRNAFFPRKRENASFRLKRLPGVGDGKGKGQEVTWGGEGGEGGDDEGGRICRPCIRPC